MTKSNLLFSIYIYTYTNTQKSPYIFIFMYTMLCKCFIVLLITPALWCVCAFPVQITKVMYHNWELSLCWSEHQSLLLSCVLSNDWGVCMPSCGERSKVHFINSLLLAWAQKRIRNWIHKKHDFSYLIIVGCCCLVYGYLCNKLGAFVAENEEHW